MLLAGRAFRRYEAGDGDEACFTYPIEYRQSDNLVVDYNVTSEEIFVHMNLRSASNNSIILRSRLLPARFKSWFENCNGLTEPYEVEFCASSGITGDSSALTSAAIFNVSSRRPGLCLLQFEYSLTPHPTQSRSFRRRSSQPIT